MTGLGRCRAAALTSRLLSGSRALDRPAGDDRADHYGIPFPHRAGKLPSNEDRDHYSGSDDDDCARVVFKEANKFIHD